MTTPDRRPRVASAGRDASARALADASRTAVHDGSTDRANCATCGAALPFATTRDCGECG